jgi:hypothetical protein
MPQLLLFKLRTNITKNFYYATAPATAHLSPMPDRACCHDDILAIASGVTSASDVGMGPVRLLFFSSKKILFLAQSPWILLYHYQQNVMWWICQIGAHDKFEKKRNGRKCSA